MQVVIVFPDESEYFEEVNLTGCHNKNAVFQGVADDAIRKTKRTTSRRNPEPITVKIYVIEACHGKQSRRYIKQLAITPPLAPLSEEEFNQELYEILLGIPHAFRDFVSGWSYEHGHAFGYEEVLSIACELVARLKPAIEKHEQEGQS